MRPTRSKITMITVILTLFLALVGSPAAGQSCDVETDEFSGEKEISCDYVDIAVEDQPAERLTSSRAMFVSIDGETVLIVYSKSDSWNFLDVDSAYALIDNNRAEWSLKRIETQTTDYGSVEELHGMVVTRSELRRIANSQTFRMRVGGAVYDLSDTAVNQHAEELLAKL